MRFADSRLDRISRSNLARLAKNFWNGICGRMGREMSFRMSWDDDEDEERRQCSGGNISGVLGGLRGESSLEVNSWYLVRETILDVPKTTETFPLKISGRRIYTYA
jgi:hypothetical protein